MAFTDMLSLVVVYLGAVFSALSIVRALFIKQRDINGTTDSVYIDKFMRWADSRTMLTTSETIFASSSVPYKLIIGKWFAWVAYIGVYDFNGRKGTAYMTASIWRFRFIPGKDIPWPESYKLDKVEVEDDIETGRDDSNNDFNTPLLNKSKDEERFPELSVIKRRDVYLGSGFKRDREEAYDKNKLNKTSIETATAIHYWMRLLNRNNDYFSAVIAMNSSGGKGKTYAARRLAVAMNAVFCEEYNCTTPGDNIDELIRVAEPTKDQPLVIVIEEFEKIFKNFSKFEQHKWLTRDVTEKDSWNRLLDKISRTKWVIMILNTNENIEELRKKNNSNKECVRPGRLFAVINLGDADYLDEEPELN
jgi:hypothetical protein